jgi:hypothetical protein
VRTFDYVFPVLLILSVLRQVRGKHLTWFQLAWPVGLVLWAAAEYVRGFPATTADLILVSASTVLGAGLGALAGRYTAIYRRADGALMARATLATVALWTLGTVGRLAFGLYAEHGGGPTIARFSNAHGVAIGAWAAALTLMALAEVLGRTTILAPRAAKATRAAPSSRPPGRSTVRARCRRGHPGRDNAIEPSLRRHALRRTAPRQDED